jgi:RNA polymerase sigma factor (sigma-70 family)
MNVPEPTAEEVAADVLMTVHGKLRNFLFGSRAKLTTWIFEIAKNRAIDYHRAHKPEHQELTASTPSAEQQVDVSPSRRVDAQMRWLRTQLSRLSDQDQHILKWRALDFPFGQIAKWLNISDGAARVRHKRALDKLKKQANTAISQGGLAHE